MKRIFLFVLDSCGIGEAPDASAFGDAGANTMKRISTSPKFCAQNLIKLGLGAIDGCEYLDTGASFSGAVARLRELSRGKDTTIGHWEISGIVSERPLPTYPNGFPKSILEEFSAKVGRGVLCNLPYSGTAVIDEYGEEHMKTGDLIVYTSADSVFQIAAHEEIVPLESLYEYCRIARNILTGEHGVGRVIARPFVGEAGAFRRTPNRHDFSILPPKPTMLDAISQSGKEVIAIGKITDIFVGQGITRSTFTHSNTEGMDETMKVLLDKTFTEGLCFTNLVDFDMLYGHRQDIDGYAAALAEFDAFLPSFIENMGEEDILMITADHGCDPGDTSTDHTREYVPLIIYGKSVEPKNFGTKDGFSTIARFVTKTLGVDYTPDGASELI